MVKILCRKRVNIISSQQRYPPQLLEPDQSFFFSATALTWKFYCYNRSPLSPGENLFSLHSLSRGGGSETLKAPTLTGKQKRRVNTICFSACCDSSSTNVRRSRYRFKRKIPLPRSELSLGRFSPRQKIFSHNSGQRTDLRVHDTNAGSTSSKQHDRINPFVKFRA